MTTSSPNAGFQPLYKRVAQKGRHDDVLAVVAMLCSQSLEAIFKQAESLGLPKTGPYYQRIDGDFIARLLAAQGLVATVWKECAGYKDLSEVSIAMVDYDPDWESGRCVLYHRNSDSDGKVTRPYVLDPYPHKDESLHARFGPAEFAMLPPSWFIGVTSMSTVTKR